MEKPAEAVDSAQVMASPLRVFKTVLWSFFGVRKRTDNLDDLAAVTPGQIVAAGVVGAVIFVSTLIMLVRFITR